MIRRSMVGITAAAAVGVGGLALDSLTRPRNLSERAAAGTVAPRRPAPKPADRVKAAQKPALSASQDDRDASFVAAQPQGRRQKALGKAVQQREFTGYSQAARAARTEANLLAPKAGPLSAAQARRHLLTRTTFGPRPRDVKELEKLGIDRWLDKQLSPKAADPAGDRAWRSFKLAGADPLTVRRSIDEFTWEAMMQTAWATLGRQVFGDRQLYEVVVDVFANHLHVPLPSDRAWDVGPGYHVSVIRRHAFGRYSDMLKAAMRHPGMLRFLDNDQSNRDSVNENLGRELLELHTVGVSSGYTEKDVRNSAYVLSGRGSTNEGAFKYDPDRHRTGRVKVLGWSASNTSAKEGLRMGDQYLDYLARHPSTARTIARKLAVRFVGDAPSPQLVARLAAVYLKNNTAILPMLKTLFRSSEFWNSYGDKTKRPLEDVVSSARALDVPFTGASGKGIQLLYWQLTTLGHAPLAWVSPDGYPDVAPAWASAGQMLERWSTHRALALGWWEGIRNDKLPADLKPRPSDTYKTWFDRLGLRLLGQRPDARERRGLAAFVGAPVTSKVDMGRMEWQAGHVVALLLDSPRFIVR